MQIINHFLLSREENHTPSHRRQIMLLAIIHTWPENFMCVFMVYLRRACALKTNKCVNICEKSLRLSSVFLRYFTLRLPCVVVVLPWRCFWNCAKSSLAWFQLHLSLVGDTRRNGFAVFTDVEEIVEFTFVCAIGFLLEKTFHYAVEDQWVPVSVHGWAQWISRWEAAMTCCGCVVVFQA